MPISKVIFKASSSATPEVWMDSTTATAAAEDITAPKTAMLADGVMTTGTGSGGGGGGGGSSAERKDVNFYDYDGSIVASYTTTEFASLSALPANPSHDGLTAQGWNMPSNWTLADAKTYVSTNGKADWGQMYTTASGATEIDVEFTDPNRMSPIMSLAVNGTVSIDWGDGSEAETVTGTSLTTRVNTNRHNFPAIGKYRIKVTAVTGSWGFYCTTTYLLLYKNNSLNENRVYANCIKAIRIGAGCTSIGQYAFYYCASLASITIPNSVTSIGNNTFEYCYTLASVVIPSSVTSVGQYAFAFSYSLVSVILPNSLVTLDDRMFNSSYALVNITIPNSITTIYTYTFASCYALPGVTIPSGVTSIDSNAFSNCYGLGSIHFKPATPPTVAATNAFANLPTDCIIYVPTGKRAAYTSATNYPSSSTYTYVEE